MPSFKSIAEKYKNLSLNGAFASNLDELVKKSFMWFHGHTHSSIDYFIDDTRVLCNPRGYCKKGYDYIKRENKKFDDNLIIDIFLLHLSSKNIIKITNGSYDHPIDGV